MSSKHDLKNLRFLQIYDSTGKIQVIVKNSTELDSRIKPGAAVRIEGVLKKDGEGDNREISASKIELVAQYTLGLNPFQKKGFDAFDTKFTDLVFSNRHIFVRNEKIADVLRIRHHVIWALHSWFRNEGYTLVDPPILTQITLYDEDTAFNLDHFGTNVFLTQCAAFYLESFVPAFERIYAIYPSFRAEKSRSARHTSEFWQVKAELAWANLEDMMDFAGRMVHQVLSSIEKDAAPQLENLGVEPEAKKQKPPYQVISYEKALDILNSYGNKFEYGKSFGAKEEAELMRDFKAPIWVKGMPKSVEPFPYKEDPEDKRATRTADLLAPNGFGEILGTAEKIDTVDALMERMREKKISTERIKKYKWYIELREAGSIPHSGMGMGLERLLRWKLGLPRVIDALPFPRLYGRLPYP